MSDLNIYQEYNHIKSELKALKEAELKLRNKVIKMHHQTKQEGTENFLHSRLGVKAVIVYNVNRSVDEAVLDTIWNDLTTEEREVIEYKPSVVKSKFKKLEENFPTSKLFDAITEKEGQASLTVKEI